MNGQLRIDKLYAWVATDTDGTEGVAACLEVDGTWRPLVGADMDRINSYREYAIHLGQELRTEIRLVEFATRTVLETFPCPTTTSLPTSSTSGP